MQPRAPAGAHAERASHGHFSRIPQMPPPRKAASAAARPSAAVGRPDPVARARPRRTTPRVRPLDALGLGQDSLGYRLRRAQVHAYALFFEMLGDLQLSPARLTALSVIAGETDISQAAMARRLDVAGPSAMKLIDGLEAAGLIRRLEVADDRRRNSLTLTDAGRAALQTLRRRHAAYEARLAAPLTAAEREQLMTLLQRLLG